MKRAMKKLRLSTETIRHLQPRSLETIVAGDVFFPYTEFCPSVTCPPPPPTDPRTVVSGGCVSQVSLYVRRCG